MHGEQRKRLVLQQVLLSFLRFMCLGGLVTPGGWGMLVSVCCAH